MIGSVSAPRRPPVEGRFARLWPLTWAVWLLFLYPTLAQLIATQPPPARLVAILAAIALFVAVYLWAAWHTVLDDVDRFVLPWQLPGPRWIPVAALYILSFILIAVDGSRWLQLLIYTSATIGGRLPTRLATGMVGKLTLLTVVAGLLTGAELNDLLATTLLVGGIGMSVVTLCWAVTTNRALRDAREDNARLAVTAERLRIARDLHDLMGHDLSLIALKSELAEYLVATSPDQAVVAMRDVASVARTALQEVRAAVAGYRQPTLASELRGAREMLAAAGVAYACEGAATSVPPALEAVLGWTVREGVTNVIRHSRARSCMIRVIQKPGSVGIEVVDDGPGPLSKAPPEPGSGGSGLSGLAERVKSLGGTFEAGPRLQGGFWLFVELPIAEQNVATDLAAASLREQVVGGGGQ
jgi:two-component system sensor histidine kinase DesK